MKRFLLITVMLFIAQLGSAIENDSLLNQAREFSSKKDYSSAITCYKKYLKETSNTKLKEIYIEYANNYYLNNQKKEAIQAIRIAIEKHGFVEQDFIYNKTLNEKLSDDAWAAIYDDYFVLRDRYLASQ